MTITPLCGLRLAAPPSTKTDAKTQRLRQSALYRHIRENGGWLRRIFSTVRETYLPDVLPLHQLHNEFVRVTCKTFLFDQTRNIQPVGGQHETGRFIVRFVVIGVYDRPYSVMSVPEKDGAGRFVGDMWELLSHFANGKRGLVNVVVHGNFLSNFRKYKTAADCP